MTAAFVIALIIITVFGAATAAPVRSRHSRQHISDSTVRFTVSGVLHDITVTPHHPGTVLLLTHHSQPNNIGRYYVPVDVHTCRNTFLPGSTVRLTLDGSILPDTNIYLAGMATT